jgi:RNA polymerase-binding transcription factor DksA
MKTRWIEHFEKLILQERDRCLQMLHQLESEEAEPQSESGGDTIRGLKRMAEAASDTLEQETDFASVSRLSSRLQELDSALDVIRMAPNLFGFCRECGCFIEVRRLELLPWALECGPCARQTEPVSVR